MLSHDDLDRLVEQSGDGVIKRSMYCARCGYNLRSLPYRYNCPECGNSYRARAIRRKGIFLEDESYFPTSECFYALVSGLLGGGLFAVCISQWSVLGLRVRFVVPGLLLAGAFLTMLSLVNARQAFRLYLEYRSRHQVIKSVQAQRREEAMHD